MASNQVYLFIIFSLVGIIIGLLFDIFRILRKIYKTNDIVTYIEDIIFWIITGIIIVYSMYNFCDGELRFFMIIGIILGVVLYSLTLSQFVIKISLFIINLIKKFIIYPCIKILKFIKMIIFRPIFIFCINLRKIILEFVKKRKKVGDFLKKRRNIIV